ncbi:MAG: ribonuclease P protein component [Phycisphaerae bacterium]
MVDGPAADVTPVCRASGATPRTPNDYNACMDDPTPNSTPPAGRTPAPQRPRRRYKLTRRQKLKGRTTVELVYKTGRRRLHHPLLVHIRRREDEGPSRLGISIGRRCGNAVQRNRIKRLLREAYRAQQHELPEGRDFLLIVRPHACLTLAEYKERLRQLLGGTGV